MSSPSSQHAKDDKKRLLVVDDEHVIREILADFLSLEGYYVRTAADGQAALTELSRQHYDLVLSDLKMPNMGGIELLNAVQDHDPNTVVIIMTGFGTVETAINAMKQGAYDYILKPFKVEEVIHTIERGLEKQRLETENLRLQETLSLYKVSEAIASSLSLEQVLDTLTNASIQEVKSDMIAVFLENGEGGFYERIRRLHERFRPIRDTGRINIAHAQARLREGAPIRCHGNACQDFFIDDGSMEEAQSLIISPLRVRDRLIGFACCVNYQGGQRFDGGQQKLLTMIASRAAAAIDNANLYENLRASFHQTISGLASAIDKMDRYTAGHSERVAAYAQILAIKVGLDDAAVELIRQSALMHDVGKIGCVLNLNKPGKLSQGEYDVFKKHPDYGRDILQPIKFLHPLIPGVHLHHERWDGLGYPLGLGGEKIPLMARIISVADTYDAMTSDRAYRKALPHEVAVNEISRCSGTQFDPDMVSYFNKIIEEVKEQKDLIHGIKIG